MDESNWDVFCSRDVLGSLWIGFNLAHRLAELGRSVRLFTDGVHELSVAQADIEPDLWVQFCGSFEVIDSRVAPWCAPVPNIVQSLGCEIVASYLSRFTAQATPGHWINVVEPWVTQPVSSPLNAVETTSTYRSYVAKLGGIPPGAGYIREPLRPQSMPDRWCRKRGLGALLKLLGLSSHQSGNELSVFVSTHSAEPVERWIEMLAAQPEGTCVFVPAGALQTELSPALNLPAARTGIRATGSLTVIFLPKLSWSVLGDLIGCCDLVLTDEPDLVLRGAMIGVPVLWASDRVAAEQVLEWSLAGTPSEVRAVMLDAALAFPRGEHLAAAWRQLGAVIQYVQVATNRVGAGMQRAPDMADVLVSGVGGSSTFALESMFALSEPARSLAR